MIDSLSGVVQHKEPSLMVIACGGVGYACRVSLQTAAAAGAVGEETMLMTHLAVREDEIALYGFATRSERTCFLQLLGVSGVGPKIALAVLSGLTIGDLQLAIAEGNAKRLASVKGIGKKTAERIVIDLKDKVNPIEAVANATAASADDAKAGMVRDALLALTALGFNEDTARKQVQQVLADDPAVSDTETIIRRALSGK